MEDERVKTDLVSHYTNLYPDAISSIFCDVRAVVDAVVDGVVEEHGTSVVLSSTGSSLIGSLLVDSATLSVLASV